MVHVKDSGVLNRLKRIEGQVRGIQRMVEDDRYCIDILHQIQAIKAAIGKVESEVLRTHASHCIRQAVSSGDVDEQFVKFSELIDLFEKAKR